MVFRARRGPGRQNMDRFLAVGWVALFLGVGLSGCAAEDPGEPQETSDQGSEQSEGDEPAPGGNGTGEASASPIAAVIVVLVEGNATSPENGSVPASVGANVTLDGSGSQGDNLSFAWDFGDGATGTNATEVHAFGAAGLYNVTLTVARGNESDEAGVSVNVTAAGPAPGEIIHTDRKTFTGTLTVGNPNTATAANVDYRDHVVEILGTTPNGTAIANHARITLDGSGAANVAMFLYWRSPSGTNLASSTAQTPDQSVDYQADMPPGQYVVRVRLFAGANAAYTVTAEIDYAAA